MLHPWQFSLRFGFFPQMSNAALSALEAGLEQDSPEIMQTFTTEPPPLQKFAQCTPERACAIGFAGWKGEHLETIDQVDKYFTDVTVKAGHALGDMTGVQPYFIYYDEGNWNYVRPALLAEVRLELAKRRMVAA